MKKNTNVAPKKTPIPKSKSLKAPLVKAKQTNDKSKLKKEIEDKKLPLIDKYTKDFIDIDIKIEDSNMPTQLQEVPKKPPTKPKQKQDEEIIKKSITKIEKMYLDCLKNTENIRISETSTTEELLKQEVIFLKTKNEVLKLKSDFFETIFYTSKNIVEAQLVQSDLKEKLIGIFSQNNQNYYETFNFLQKRQFDIFSIEKTVDNDQIINKKCLNTIKTIEDNLALILRDIQSFIKEDDNRSPVVFRLKESILSSSKRILSYYVLSDNYTYDFKGRSTFWVNNSEEYLKFEVEQRTKKIIEDLKQIMDPMLNKVLTKKNKSDISNHLKSVCSFYENYNQLLMTENSHLKCFNSSILLKLNSKIDKFQKAIDEFIVISKDAIIKLTEVIEFLFNNQSKNMEKVLYSLVNTEKDIIKDMIFSYNAFIDKYNLIK